MPQACCNLHDNTVTKVAAVNGHKSSHSREDGSRAASNDSRLPYQPDVTMEHVIAEAGKPANALVTGSEGDAGDDPNVDCVVQIHVDPCLLKRLKLASGICSASSHTFLMYFSPLMIRSYDCKAVLDWSAIHIQTCATAVFFKTLAFAV